VTAPVIFRRTAGLLPAGIFTLALLLGSGCRPPPEEDVLLRYRYRPGETLVYRVSLRGEGEVLMTMSVEGEEREEEDRIPLPVSLEGDYLMELKVEEVSPEGRAQLSLSYREFNLSSVSRIRDREIVTSLTDRGLTITEDDRLISEIGRDDDGYPLRGVVGEEFRLRVDDRGTVLEARVPPAPERIFPSLQFDAFLERMQPEFPREPVPAGASWSRTVEVPVSGLGRQWDRGERWEVRLESTFRGFDDRRRETALIDFSGSYRQETPELPEGSGLRSSSHHLTGTFQFDVPGGRVISSSSTLRQNLELRAAFDQVLRGRSLDIRVEDKVEVSVRLEE